MFYSNYRPWPPSADMSKTETDRSKEKEESLKVKKEEKTEKSKKKHAILKKETMSTKMKPAGKKGAPVVKESNRPQRAAARAASKAWQSLKNISLSPHCKHP